MPMNAKNVRVNLQYDWKELRSLFSYAQAHDVQRAAGRYDTRTPPWLNIWTHAWSHPGCKAESSLMFSLAFDCGTALLMSLVLHPGYDWELFLDELATLEWAALGYPAYGRRRAEAVV